jgi:hypothetical protein
LEANRDYERRKKMNAKWLKWILAAGAVLVVPVLVGIYGVSIVQASTGPELAGSIDGPNTLAHPGFGGSDMQALLAEELGISVEELEAAQQAAFEAAVAIAVDEGKITQEQADQILEGDGFHGRGFGPGRGRFNGELPEGFEPGEGFVPGRGKWHPFGPPEAPQEDTSNT